jgi:hypothetical protein
MTDCPAMEDDSGRMLASGFDAEHAACATAVATPPVARSAPMSVTR